MEDEKISALGSGSPIQDTDEFILARSGDNKKVTGANLKLYSASPIAILKNDVASATDLIDGQMYEVTGFATFTSTLKINRGYFLAKYNLQSGVVEMSTWGHVQISLGDGATFDSDCAFDWYDTGNPALIHEPYYNNRVEGFANINKFPFLTGTDVSGNKVGSGFTLDITALTAEKFNDNTCYGNGTFTAVAGRDYEGIDFTKGYFELNFQFTFDGTPSPGDGSSIVIQKNELGVVPTIAHTGSGNFRLTSALANSLGATIDKCNLIYQHVYDGVSFVTMSADWISDTRIEIFVWDSLTGSLNDLAIANASFRIQVYF
jgi:hypothetical protein